MKIKVIIGKHELEAELDGSINANEVYSSLPQEGTVNRWGAEIYFDFPLNAISENMKQTMEIGDLGYWIEGQALAIFFGPTPASTDSKPRAAVPVTFLGRIKGDTSPLHEAEIGDTIRLVPDTD